MLKLVNFCNRRTVFGTTFLSVHDIRSVVLRHRRPVSDEYEDFWAACEAFSIVLLDIFSLTFLFTPRNPLALPWVAAPKPDAYSGTEREAHFWTGHLNFSDMRSTFERQHLNFGVKGSIFECRHLSFADIRSILGRQHLSFADNKSIFERRHLSFSDKKSISVRRMRWTRASELWLQKVGILALGT